MTTQAQKPEWKVVQPIITTKPANFIFIFSPDRDSEGVGMLLIIARTFDQAVKMFNEHSYFEWLKYESSAAMGAVGPARAEKISLMDKFRDEDGTHLIAEWVKSPYCTWRIATDADNTPFVEDEDNERHALTLWKFDQAVPTTVNHFKDGTCMVRTFCTY